MINNVFVGIIVHRGQCILVCGIHGKPFREGVGGGGGGGGGSGWNCYGSLVQDGAVTKDINFYYET